ncbi:MAG: hypothetical protein ACLPSH_15885 [Vulcanimicrobiaceae bacterium]|jgi:hypothetical protein
MIVMMLVAALASLSLLAARFGADSRDVERSGWIVERPQRVRSGARVLQTGPYAPAARRSRPAAQLT